MRKMSKRIGVLAAALLLLVSLTACGDEAKEPNYSALIEEPLDISLGDCLDAATLNTLIGYDMELVGVFEDGTQMVFTGIAGSQVMVNAINETRQGFDDMMANMTNLEVVEGLGEVAWWNGGELMVYANGYALSVAVRLSDDVVTLPHAKSITEHILGKLNG